MRDSFDTDIFEIFVIALGMASPFLVGLALFMAYDVVMVIVRGLLE